MPAGQMTIQATNNGKDFGIGASFTITGNISLYLFPLEEENINLLI